MSTMTVLRDHEPGRPYVVADLAAIRDEDPHHRYELIDGVLIVTPAPIIDHQRTLRNLFRMVDNACPEGYEVMFAPLDITSGDDTMVQPDLLMASEEVLAGPTAVGMPVLAVEVLSPSTRLIDLNLKRSKFEQLGVEHYWVVAPASAPDGPWIVAWALRDGSYAEVASVRAGERFVVSAPISLDVAVEDIAGSAH